MPNSERAQKLADELAGTIIYQAIYPKWAGKSPQFMQTQKGRISKAILDDLKSFALLERAEARRETIEDVREIQLSVAGMTECEEAFAHQKKFSKGDANGIAAVLEVVQRRLRAKLTPAPEAEQGQKL